MDGSDMPVSLSHSPGVDNFIEDLVFVPPIMLLNLVSILLIGIPPCTITF